MKFIQCNMMVIHPWDRVFIYSFVRQMLLFSSLLAGLKAATDLLKTALNMLAPTSVHISEGGLLWAHRRAVLRQSMQEAMHVVSSNIINRATGACESDLNEKLRSGTGRARHIVPPLSDKLLPDTMSFCIDPKSLSSQRNNESSLETGFFFNVFSMHCEAFEQEIGSSSFSCQCVFSCSL